MQTVRVLLLLYQSGFLLFLFLLLIDVVKTSKTMLNSSGESGHPCLVPDFRGNGFNFSPLRIMFAVGFICFYSWRDLYSLHCSLKKAFLLLLAILWNSTFSWVYFSFSLLPFASLLFSDICKVSSDNDITFFNFSFFGMVLVTAFCTMLWTSVQSL